MLNVPISPRRIFALLLIFTGGLTLANIAGQYYKYFDAAQNPVVLKVIEIVDFNAEKNNLPDWYQSSSLLFCAILLGAAALIQKRERRRDARFWQVLAGIFLYLSVEEIAGINYYAALLLDRAFNFSGCRYSGLIVTAAVLTFICLILPFETLFRLPSKTRRLFIFAGLIYALGAIVFDQLGPTYFDLHNYQLAASQKFSDSMFVAAEEFFEMIGIAIFIRAFLSYLNCEESNTDWI